MKTLKMDSSTPNFIRAELRRRLYYSLEILSEIIDDPDTRPADKIKAIHVLGKFGLGAADQAQVHIHAGDGAQVIGVVRLPALGEDVDDQGKSVEIRQGGMGLPSENGLGMAS